MLNWIRDKLFKRQSIAMYSSTSLESSDNLSSKHSNTQLKIPAEQIKTDQICLHIIHEGEIWIITVDRKQLISELIHLSIGHFLNPLESTKLFSKYRFISVLPKRVLHSQRSVEEEELENNDEIILAATVSTGPPIPFGVSLQDVKGPSKGEIMEATAHLTKKHSIQVVPALDCQENFQSEIQKVLFSLVEASAKILAQSPDAKVIFDGIAARISAKNKKEIDKNSIKYLKDLGFTEAQARYALRLKRNRQIEAMEWLLENSHRVKEDSPENKDGASTSAVAPPTTESVDDNPLHTINKLLKDIRDFHHRHFEPNTKALENLKAMGFKEDDAIEALKVTGNNPVSACEVLCGERDPNVYNADAGLDKDGPLYKALMNNPAIQLGLYNPKIMLAFLSILENASTANLWLNDVDTAPVLGQVFKTYHSEKHIMAVNQQMELMRSRAKQS